MRTSVTALALLLGALALPAPALAQGGGGGGKKQPPATPGDEEATRAAELKELLRKINGRNAQERIAAAGGLAAVGKGSKEAVNALANHLSDGDPRVRAACAEGLGRIDEGSTRVVGALGAMLAQKAPVKAAAASGLSCFGEKARPAIPQLIKALPEATEPVERQKILRAFALIGSADPKQKKSMVEGARAELNKGSEDRDVKVAASIALARLGEQDPATVAVLGEAASAARADVPSRREAVDALAVLGPVAEPAIPQLIAIVKEAFVENSALPYQDVEKKQHGALRAAAAKALGGLGKAARPALSALDSAVAANADEALSAAAKEAAEKIRAAG